MPSDCLPMADMAPMTVIAVRRKSWLLLGWLCFGLSISGLDVWHLSSSGNSSHAAILCIHAVDVRLVTAKRSLVPTTTHPAEVSVLGGISLQGVKADSPMSQSVDKELAECTMEQLKAHAEQLKQLLKRQRLPKATHFTAFGLG